MPRKASLQGEASSKTVCAAGLGAFGRNLGAENNQFVELVEKGVLPSATLPVSLLHDQLWINLGTDKRTSRTLLENGPLRTSSKISKRVNKIRHRHTDM